MVLSIISRNVLIKNKEYQEYNDSVLSDSFNAFNEINNDFKDQVWMKRFGNQEWGLNFKQRQVRYYDYQNFSSPYGWVIMEFEVYEKLVIHVITVAEINNSMTLGIQ